MTSATITYVHGLPENMRQAAAQLYDQAFGRKFSVAVPSTERRLDLLARSFCLPFAFGAVLDGQLVGLAGYHSESGSLTGGMTYKQLISCLGVIGGHRAALIFSLYERVPLSGEMLMDGIAVSKSVRGQGIGTQLLSRLAEHARSEQLASIRLDVIDSNPQAQRLYARNGFVVTRTERYEYLRWLLGFGGSSTMIRSLCNV